MLGIFRHNNPLSILLLLVLAFVAEYFKVGNAHVIADHPTTLLYKGVTDLLSPLNAQEHLSTNIIRYLIITAEAFYLNKIAIDNKLLERSTFLVALSFLLLNFLIPFKASFLLLLINAILMIVFHIFIIIYKKNNPFNNILLCGFLIASLSLIVNSYMIFYVWLTIALLVMRPSSIREWSVMNIGFLIPYYFIVSVLYLIDKFSLDAIATFVTPTLHLPVTAPVVLAKMALVVLLPLIGFSIGSTSINKMVLQNRKAYIIMFALMLGVILINILNMDRINDYFYLTIVPAAVLFAPFFQSFRKDFIPNLVLVLLILLSCIR